MVESLSVESKEYEKLVSSATNMIYDVETRIMATVDEKGNLTMYRII